MKDLSLSSDRFKRLSSSAPDATSLKAATITACMMFTNKFPGENPGGLAQRQPARATGAHQPSCQGVSVPVRTAEAH
eukprot:4977700-Amphidinium_carterae.1